MQDNSTRIIRIREALSLTGESRSSAYRKIAAGEWPRPIHIGKRAVGFVETEILELNARRIAESRR